jgi:peptidoglycan/xylan/chitin deacetylase (PgdA/CDA1 family)
MILKGGQPMAAVFILVTLLFLIIFLMMGFTSRARKARHSFLYFTLAAVSLLFLIIVMFFSSGLSTQAVTAFHSGKHTASSFVKIIPAKPLPVEEAPPPEDEGTETPPENESPGNDQPDSSDKEPQRGKIEVPSDKIVEYTVVKGDGLWSISSRAEVSSEALKQWNGLSSDTIYIGQILKIYGKDIAPPPAPPVQDSPPATGTPSVLVSHGSQQKQQIALTFDAGSDSVGISILDVLKKHNVKATFFLTGKWVEKFPDHSKRILNDGHSLGNHTYSHPDSLSVSSQVFKEDILKAEKAILAVTGKSPRPYFRFPYGSYDDKALKTVGEAGYKYSFHWTIDTIDWKQPSAEYIVNRIINGASNGDIILLHIGGINTPAAIDKAIPILKADGFELVTLDVMMK